MFSFLYLFLQKPVPGHNIFKYYRMCKSQEEIHQKKIEINLVLETNKIIKENFQL